MKIWHDGYHDICVWSTPLSSPLLPKIVYFLKYVFCIGKCFLNLCIFVSSFICRLLASYPNSSFIDHLCSLWQQTLSPYYQLNLEFIWHLSNLFKHLSLLLSLIKTQTSLTQIKFNVFDKVSKVWAVKSTKSGKTL